MKNKVLSIALAVIMVMATAVSLVMVPSAAESVTMTPMHGEPFQPDGVTFGRVSFIVPDTAEGLTKDAWDDSIDHNTDLILLSYEKDGTVYVDKTIREIKAQLGNLALVRTCYTYDDAANGGIRLNLVFHFDDYSKLTPSDIISVTVKSGFVWCAGSPSGISGELSALTLNQDVIFYTGGEPGITGVKTGNMGSEGTVLNVRFDRNDNATLKAISAVNLSPSAIPGKTLGDLVTIGGVTVTELVREGKVARFNFYGETLVFHIDDAAYMNQVKTEHLEFVILPGFQWLNWDRDDWGNWAGTHKDDYFPVEGTLVKQPIAFYIDENGEVCVQTDGITVEPGYKDTYYVGESIDMTSLLVRIQYAGGESEAMPILESMVTYDFSKAGTATVYIDVNGMTTSYTVTVLESPETAPETGSETEPETNAASETEVESTEETQAETESHGGVTETLPDAEGTEGSATEGASGTEAGDTDGAEGSCQSSLAILPTACILLSAVALIFKKNED